MRKVSLKYHRQWPVQFYWNFHQNTVIFIVVDKTCFNQYGWHFRTFKRQDSGVGYTEILKPAFSSFLIDIARKHGFDAGIVVYKCFHTVVLVRALWGIAVNGYKVIRTGIIGIGCLFKWGFILIIFAYIVDIDTAVFKNLSDSAGQPQCIVFFLRLL